MNPDLEKLIELQRADVELARLNAEVAALPKRVAAIEAKLAGTQGRVEGARAALKATESNRRKYESQISDLRQKISKYRDQSLAVKTNDQYRALMHEIGFAEKDITSLEDKILEGMLETENREKELKELEVELRAENTEIDKEKAEARARTTEDEQQMAEWSAQRSRLRSAIEDHTLRHYDRVLKFRGSGLAEVIGHKCVACQVMLRPQVFNDVKTNEHIVACDSCQRILYFILEHQPPEEAEAAEGRVRKGPHKAWYYLPDYRGTTPVFLAFVDGKGNCAMRVYDAEAGQKLEPTSTEPGEFRAAFSQYVREGTRIRASLNVEHLEEWGEQLPPAELTDLHAALHEAFAAEAQASAEQVPVSQQDEDEPAPDKEEAAPQA